MGFKFNKVIMQSEEEIKQSINAASETAPQQAVSEPVLKLSKAETETLISMIRQASFKGEHVQQVYTLVLKLQEYYTKIDK